MNFQAQLEEKSAKLRLSIYKSIDFTQLNEESPSKVAEK